VTHDTSTFRNKEQVLYDLSKAMGFSPESLEANRVGRLSTEQFKKFIGPAMAPLGVAIISAAAPFLLWISLTGMREHLGFFAAANLFVGQLMHLSETAESQGKISTLTTLVTIAAGVGFALYQLSRFSLGMYFDLLSLQVAAREGRVIAREEQILRPNGRDPIEKYFFDAKDKRYDVNYTAYKAIESGSTYILYVLPRSGKLVSMEPKVFAKADTPSPAPAPPAAPVSI